MRLANRRIRLLLFGFTVVLLGAFVRAFWLEGVRASAYDKMAVTQQREVVTVPARRGTIFDRTGAPLAIGEPATTVYADPHQITNPRRVATTVAAMLHLNANIVYREISDRSRGFVYLERQAPPGPAARLQEKKLPGLGFYSEERRTYPQNQVGASVLGYAGVDDHGLAGLEVQLDKQLSGHAGKQTLVKDPFGRPVDIANTRPVRDGKDAYLTIDHTIQANADTVLERAVQRWGAKDATAIVMDPRNGAVLAMANAPGFDANRYPDAGGDRQRNRAVTDTFEPGSTFKLVTAAGVLSEHLVTPQSSFTLPPSIQVADKVIHDAEPRGTVTYTVSDIVAKSSNVGAITLAEMLGRDRLASWISRFGFGHETGIDFPGESPGIVAPPDQWYGSQIGTIPIGQGIAVTPIQLASAYAAVANGGVWVTPHLVERIHGGRPPKLKHRRVVAPAVDAELKQMLRGVVIEGTGTNAAIPGYSVAGKTGTANIPDGHGGYLSEYVASFVGFVPASRPRLVILVSVNSPQGAIFGGTVSAPVFQKIAKFDLQYLEIPPDQARH
jgi:cell division protein FtsI (penicillin-binding protein 3)